MAIRAIWNRLSLRILGPILLVFVFVTSCSPEESLSVKLSDLEQVRFDVGYHFDSVTLSDGIQVPFVTRSPGVTVQSKLPLIVVLHGGGQTGQYQGESVLKSLFHPALKDIRAVFVAPTATTGHWATPRSVEMVVALVEGIVDAGWPIDPNKIVVTGYSAGATGIWYLTGSEASLFRAGIPVAGDPVSGSSGDLDLVPKYVIHSHQDEVFSFDDVQLDVESLIEEGVPIVFHPVEGISHNAFAAYVPAVQSAVPWLKQILE